MQEKIIGEMVDRIVERFHPQMVVLFGSHAQGNAGPDSDVDLLVVMPINGSRRKIATEIFVLLSGMGIPKDIIIVTPEEVDRYRDIPGTIIRPAINHGKVLYERSA